MSLLKYSLKRGPLKKWPIPFFEISTKGGVVSRGPQEHPLCGQLEPWPFIIMKFIRSPLSCNSQKLSVPSISKDVLTYLNKQCLTLHYSYCVVYIWAYVINIFFQKYSKRVWDHALLEWGTGTCCMPSLESRNGGTWGEGVCAPRSCRAVKSISTQGTDYAPPHMPTRFAPKFSDFPPSLPW